MREDPFSKAELDLIKKRPSKGRVPMRIVRRVKGTLTTTPVNPLTPEQEEAMMMEGLGQVPNSKTKTARLLASIMGVSAERVSAFMKKEAKRVEKEFIRRGGEKAKNYLAWREVELEIWRSAYKTTKATAPAGESEEDFNKRLMVLFDSMCREW